MPEQLTSQESNEQLLLQMTGISYSKGIVAATSPFLDINSVPKIWGFVPKVVKKAFLRRTDLTVEVVSVIYFRHPTTFSDPTQFAVMKFTEREILIHIINKKTAAEYDAENLPVSWLKGLVESL